MDEFLSVFLIIGLILILVISIITALILSERKIKKEVAEENARREAQKKAEEEARRKTKCLICEKCSMGHAICDECYDRSQVLIKELPSKRTHTYDALNEYRKELMRKVVYPKTRFDRETDSIKLVSIADILKTKYCNAEAFQDIYEFFEDVIECPVDSRDELIQYYELYTESDLENSEEPQKEEKESTDHKTTSKAKESNAKPFHCKDGHDVRSKAEREIDNFLFDNQVWHVYEYKYEHPVTKDWAIPDFYLPNYNLYIEYFCLNTPEYIKNREHKIKMYRSDPSIRFEYLTYEDDGDIYDKLRHIFIKYNIPLK